MICMDVNLKLYFDNLPNGKETGKETGNKTECETAFVELFDEVLIDFKEYVKAKAEIKDIKEVIE